MTFFQNVKKRELLQYLSLRMSIKRSYPNNSSKPLIVTQYIHYMHTTNEQRARYTNRNNDYYRNKVPHQRC